MSTANPASTRRPKGLRRQIRQPVSFVGGLALVWLTIGGIAARTSFDLTIALLVVLAEVLLVATLAGPLLGMGVALVSVVLINWYLVPPFHTFEIANPENVTALIVFALVAIVAALLVEFGSRARAQAAVSSQQAQFLADIVANERTDAPRRPALEAVREALVLDHVALRRHGPHGLVTLQQVGQLPLPGEDPVVTIRIAGGYEVVGHGPERLATDPRFLSAVADAAVRSYESDRMVDEQERAEDLAAIDRARTALLAGVGHDLRTPLSGLRVAIDALTVSAAELSDADRSELFDTISSSVDRLDELITNLLDLSRLEAGALITQAVPVNLGEVVLRAALTSAEPERLVLDVDDTLPDVVVDPALLERVLANLISNALRHTPEGTPVDVSMLVSAGGAVLRVADHGPGIPEADRGLVMEPFRQLPGAADAGSGLGLAVVAGFSAAMNLDVTFADTPGGGLTAQILVPQDAPDEANVQS